MKILILTKYGKKGASSRYRFYNYFNYLDEAGIQYEVQPLLDDDYIDALYGKKTSNLILLQFKAIIKRMKFLRKNSAKFDVFFIEKELFPYLPYSVEQYFLKNKKYLLDYDDYVGASYQSGFRKKLLGDKILNLVKNAKSVSVGNHWYFKEFKTNNLTYIPTVVDLDKYPLYNETNSVKEIVWIGSPSTVNYLKMIEEPLLKLTDNHDFTLVIIGGEINLDPRIKTRIVSWNSAEENKVLAQSTVGIMPLRKTMWEYGKCGFKIIQYMASGLPVVASDLPANEEIIAENSGKIASDNENWAKYLDVYLSNKDLAKEHGLNGRKRVEEKYSYQVWGSIFAEYVKNNLQ